MRKYFELEEILEGVEEVNEQPQIVRIEITSDDEAEKLLKDFEPFFNGRRYEARIHEHLHEEKGPCRVRLLKRVG
jgi:hypothetical protein